MSLFESNEIGKFTVSLTKHKQAFTEEAEVVITSTP